VPVAERGMPVLSFANDAVESLRTVMQMSPQPAAGVRISPAYTGDARCDLPLLQLTAVSIVDLKEIWLITDDGIPVFVDPALASLLEETVLCSAPGIDGSPWFLLAYDPPVAMPVATRRSTAPRRRRTRRRRIRPEDV
jgi:Fe-S cluster assembly iron-binding protein IscA